MSIYGRTYVSTPPQTKRVCWRARQYMAVASRSSLHELCRSGNLKALQEYACDLDAATLKAQLDGPVGALEHTVLHVAASRGHSEVLDFLIAKGGDVDHQNTVGCTPLHVAASKGNEGCVRVLLKHNSNVFRTDCHGKTAKQRAKLRRIVRLLTSAELVTAAGNKDGGTLASLMRDTTVIDQSTLSRALMAAVNVDSVCNICWLVMRGVSDISKALQVAEQDHKHKAAKVLTLIRAAQTNDRDLAASLLQNRLEGSAEGAALWSGEIPMVVPIEIARQCNHCAVREELLFGTDVLHERGTVCWHGLHLCHLEPEWLVRLDWTRHLMLAWNRLQTLPAEMACLTKVVQLELQCNNLATIPPSLLKLPSLRRLNLSFNELVDLPLVPEWSPSLTSLDLSHNRLTSIVGSPVATSLTSLNLASNRLREVPPCILHGFTKLCSLDLRKNELISRESLECLRFHGNLTRCVEDDTDSQHDGEDTRNVPHQDVKVRDTRIGGDDEGTQIMKIVLLGVWCGQNDSGLHLEWQRRQGLNDRRLHLNIWDVSGGDQSKSRECLAVGLKGAMQNVNALKEVIWRCAIVNNHRLVTTDQRLTINHTSLVRLGEMIQNAAQNGSCKPVLRKEEFKDLICKSNLLACEDEGMASVVGHSLCMVGIILHYNTPSHNLDDLYFVSPRFLCKTVLRTVRNSFIRGGILHTRHLPALFGNNCLVAEYLEQYVMLLSHCNIALAVDNQALLIPSMLPDMHPVGTGIQGMRDELMYTRHFILDCPLGVFPGSIPDFWNQLLVRIMHFVPRVRFALENSPSGSEKAAPHWTSGEPLLIPNVQGPLPYKPSHSNNAVAMWWRGSIVYHDTELEFQVELLHNTEQKIFEGVLITASRSLHGAKVFGQLVKIAARLFVSLPRGHMHAANNEEAMEVKQVAPCYICAKLGHPSPLQVQNLMLHDLDPGLMLNVGSLSITSSAVVLGTGNSSTVYQGQHKGANVAIKLFHGTPRDAFTQLRKEVTLLHNLRHPYVVPLIGALLYPAMALVTEEAPLGSLDKVVIKRRQAVHRLVLHRIVTQVAAALGYLHTNGIVRCECRASDVLVWSLDPGSLFHCKLGNFGMAKELDPIGAQLPRGTTEFIAPEALTVGKGGDRHLLCDKRADVYSVKLAVLKGERPELRDIPLAETSYFYLTRLMQRCWDGCPDRRPTTAEVVGLLCLPSVQSVMAVSPVEMEHTVRSAHLVPPARGDSPHDSTLWVCCDGADSVEVVTYEVRTMTKQEGFPISDQQLLHCSLLTARHLWVCTSRRQGNSELSAFDVHSRKLEKRIALQENAMYSLACSERMIYCGMHEGLCVAYDQEAGVRCSSQKLSDYRIDGLAVAPDFLWASTLHRIFLLDLATLEDRYRSEENNVISALTPVLDTVWVAMVTGHIMVFHDKEVLTWFRPYKEYVRFLTYLHCNDPYHSEKAVVVSGAKEFIPSMVAGLNKDVPSPSNLAVTLVMWEAFPAKQCRQMQFVNDNATCFTANEAEMAVTITKGGFNDGILKQKKGDLTKALAGLDAVPVETQSEDSESTSNLSNSHSRQGLQVDTLYFSMSTCNITSSSGEPSFLGSACALPSSSTADVLDIRISRFDGERIQVSCPTPVILMVVLDKLAEWQQNNSDTLPQSIDCYVLSYYLIDTVHSVFVRTQLDLDRYLLQARRPPLLLTQRV
eukprot:Em0495g5a